jgi:phosphatidylserine decarboxylase
MAQYDPAVLELVELIKANAWTDDFDAAIASARRNNIAELESIRSLDDYLGWMDGLLRWVPTENMPGSEVYNALGKFCFILDQPTLLALQTSIEPHAAPPPLTLLSEWMVHYAQALGAFLDTPESLTAASMQTFQDSPNYNMHDYIVPHGGWRTFNQFFARNFKPGYRPIAGLCDPNVIVSAADSTFAGQWEIRSDSAVTVKNLHWPISELLEGSPYAQRFRNGTFMHAFLSPTDYHRQHAPVAGKILEARVIAGQVSIEITAEPVPDDADGRRALTLRRRFNAPDNAGYQFAQSRGLIVIESSIGLVAVLPIGMSQVSSVILTAEPGVTVRKGEELSYFQFGGSDIVVLFESASNVSISAQPGVHYKVGAMIARAMPG